MSALLAYTMKRMHALHMQLSCNRLCVDKEKPIMQLPNLEFGM